jgi:hypothetical protein
MIHTAAGEASLAFLGRDFLGPKVTRSVSEACGITFRVQGVLPRFEVDIAVVMLNVMEREQGGRRRPNGSRR